MEPSDYKPEHCVWELTLRCNMRCLHCGSIAGKARESELTVEECLDVADQLLALGNRVTTLIGGEAFLYQGWEQVGRRLTDGGAAVNLITNGFLMGDEQIEQIRHAGLVNAGVSLDGMEENHNRIRNVDTSFRRALAAMDRLRAEGVSVGVVSSLLDFNVPDLPEMYELLASRQVAVWQIQIANAMGNIAGANDLLLDPAKVPRITRFISEKRAEGRMAVYAGDDIGYYDEHEVFLRSPPGAVAVWQGCQAGIRAVGIDSVGHVKGCSSLYDDFFIEGSLREESLAAIWRKEGNFAYNRQFDASQLTGRCKGCDRGELCRGGCRGSSYFNAGAPFENPYCCYPGRPKA